MLLIAAPLSGVACTPVHSDRPLGSQPYAGPGGRDARPANQLNGLWAIHIPAGARVGAPYRYLAWFQPELDRFVVLSAADEGDATVGELALRTHRVGGEEWFFPNEEDRRLKGFFLWTQDKFPALKHPDVRAIRTPPAPPASAVSAGAP